MRIVDIGLLALLMTSTAPVLAQEAPHFRLKGGGDWALVNPDDPTDPTDPGDGDPTDPSDPGDTWELVIPATNGVDLNSPVYSSAILYDGAEPEVRLMGANLSFKTCAAPGDCVADETGWQSFSPVPVVDKGEYFMVRHAGIGVHQQAEGHLVSLYPVEGWQPTDTGQWQISARVDAPSSLVFDRIYDPSGNLVDEAIPDTYQWYYSNVAQFSGSSTAADVSTFRGEYKVCDTQAACNTLGGTWRTSNIGATARIKDGQWVRLRSRTIYGHSSSQGEMETDVQINIAYAGPPTFHWSIPHAYDPTKPFSSLAFEETTSDPDQPIFSGVAQFSGSATAVDVMADGGQLQVCATAAACTTAGPWSGMGQVKHGDFVMLKHPGLSDYSDYGSVSLYIERADPSDFTWVVGTIDLVDSDGDGIPDDKDVAPNDPSIPTPTTDTDGDGTPDIDDPRPFDPSYPVQVAAHRYWRIDVVENVAWYYPDRLRIFLFNLRNIEGDWSSCDPDDDWSTENLIDAALTPLGSTSAGLANLVDNDDEYGCTSEGTEWYHGSGTGHFGLSFSTPQVITDYEIWQPGDAQGMTGGEFRFQYSDNGIDWVTVDERNGALEGRFRAGW